jgi:hypothetical protein
MPAGNGTGPAGLGPMTGRALGYCAGYTTPGYMNNYPPVRGYGMAGFGRGFGRGYGGRFAYGRGYGYYAQPVRRPYYGFYAPPVPAYRLPFSYY